MEPSIFTIPHLSNREREAVITLLIRHAQAWWTRQRKNDLKAQIEKEIPELSQQIDNCEAGLRAFGLDPQKQEVWDAVRLAFDAEVREAIAAENRNGHQPQMSLTPPTPHTEQQSHARVQDLILERLAVVFPVGSKAAPVREYVEKKLGRPIHSKTVGMTLYRLLNKQLVSRKGHTWFFVPQDAETKNPAGDTAGHETSQT
jgi:hypothetical protein